jgi:NUBPL iron-transfer P-loop NTPase
VLGLVENMSGYVCPHCGEITPLFGQGGGEEFCRVEEEKRSRGEGDGCRFLGRLPVDRDFVVLVDRAKVEAANPGRTIGQGQLNGDGPAAEIANASSEASGPAHRPTDLLHRYLNTPSAPIFREIAGEILKLLGTSVAA